MYQDKKKELKEKWTNPTTGRGWDQAVQLQAQRLLDLEVVTGQGDNQNNELPHPETAQNHSFPGIDFGEYDIEEFEEV
jgi:hypothetical protein